MHIPQLLKHPKMLFVHSAMIILLEFRHRNVQEWDKTKFGEDMYLYVKSVCILFKTTTTEPTPTSDWGHSRTDSWMFECSVLFYYSRSWVLLATTATESYSYLQCKLRPVMYDVAIILLLSYECQVSIWITICQLVYPTSWQICTSYQVSSHQQHSLIFGINCWNIVGMCRKNWRMISFCQKGVTKILWSNVLLVAYCPASWYSSSANYILPCQLIQFISKLLWHYSPISWWDIPAGKKKQPSCQLKNTVYCIALLWWVLVSRMCHIIS